jgi:hypothetical protein
MRLIFLLHWMPPKLVSHFGQPSALKREAALDLGSSGFSI